MTDTRNGGFDAVVATLVVCLMRHELFPTGEDQSTSSIVS